MFKEGQLASLQCNKWQKLFSRLSNLTIFWGEFVICLNHLQVNLGKFYLLILSADCHEAKLSKMRQLILTTFQTEQHTDVTSKILIDELYFRYNRDGDHSVSSRELKNLVTDYVMYPNIKELAEICHPRQWLKAEDKDKNGFLSKDEFVRSFGKIKL